MDAEARYEEVLDAALEMRYVADRIVTYIRARTANELSDVAKKSEILCTLRPRTDHYRLPSRAYWARQVDRLRGQIEYFQHMVDEDKRQLAMRNLASHLVEAEENLEKAEPDPRSITDCLVVKLRGVSDFHPADQVVVAWGRTCLFDLQKVLRANGQCIPFQGANDGAPPYYASAADQGLTLEDAIGLNLPHGLEAQCGNWRDWILGMTVILADGSVVKSGSRVVKNVAGYDAHKLFVGARGTLGIVLSVTLRTMPLQSLPEKSVVRRAREPESLQDSIRARSQPLWIQRTLRSDFQRALQAAGDRVIEFDPASSTLWAAIGPDGELPRYPKDWVVRRKCGVKNLTICERTEIDLIKRAKDIFDPTHKLNPGELGVV